MLVIILFFLYTANSFSSDWCHCVLGVFPAAVYSMTWYFLVPTCHGDLILPTNHAMVSANQFSVDGFGTKNGISDATLVSGCSLTWWSVLPMH